MNQASVRPNVTAVVAKTAQLAEVEQFTPAQLKLITDTVARGASPDELKLFLYRCAKMGLDPLKAGQIFFIKYGNNPGTIVVGIEGLRSLAARTGKLKGIKRGVIRDAAGTCIGAWAKARRADWDEPAEVEVSRAEYDTGKSGWAKMPETMIQKVAEAHALRMAFPDETGDAYLEEEIEKRKDDPRPIVPEQPHPDDGVQLQSYSPKYGKFARTHLENCEPADLQEEVLKYEAEAKAKGRAPLPWQQEFITHAEPHIAAWEQQLAREMREPGSDG